MSGDLSNIMSGGASGALGGESSGIQNIINGLGPQYNNLMNPWVSQAQTGENTYNQMLSNMNNPQGFINSLMSGYQASPEAQYAQQQGIKSANAAGAASGMLGSGAEQTDLQRQGQQITQQDQQNYLNNMMDVFKTQLAGVQQGNQMNFGASNNLAQLLSQLGQMGIQQQGIQAQANEANSQGKNSGIGDIVGGGLALGGLL